MVNESAGVLEEKENASETERESEARSPQEGAPAEALPERPVVVNDARDSLVPLSLKELVAHRELLYFLTWRDIKVKYKQTAMGAAWAIIQPLFMMIVFSIFFGLFMGVPTEGMSFFLFFYSGLLPWTFFSTAIMLGSVSLVNNANLITKVYFPRIIIPASVVGAGLVDLLIASVIFAGLAAYHNVSLSPKLLMLPVFFLLTTLLSLGFGTWLAALTVKYRDVRHALPFVTQIWFFVTPIIYPLSVVDERWRWLMYANPMTGIVEGIRASLVAGRAFNWTGIYISTALTVVILIGSVYAFRRIEKSFADLI
jgi:lipopolysaccharide transport system permease protein